MAVLAYRKAIGIFYTAPIKLSCRDSIADKVPAKELCRKSCKYYIAKEYLVIIFLINVLFLASLNLTCNGDIKSNLELTYSIEKITSGSFYQGNSRFGHTAGIQCACNSLYVLCWSQVKKACR